ncbi:sensor histidine kinase [Streptomyces tubercidicus]|uniref:histidine kinase n=1 Tax=Streptomyces tubercidicus TaxID=47759 RepID=A0A640V292_9ACTN|nr:histidine kinase [Streptomyces tubercidicus]WAU15632.1 histidine kinase [Streptomyces tubercidicus]GFE41510.1 histidine kinase [Streptomyces tubercidicus]
MCVRHLWAPLRGLVLFGLGLAAAPMLAAVALGALFGIQSLAQWYRRPLNVYRTLASRWCGVDIPVPYQPPPLPPEPEPDGWYRYKNRLYLTPKKLSYERRWDWLVKDPATSRDILWMLINPVAGSVTALLPLTLVVLGATFPWYWPGHTGITVPIAVATALAGFGFGPVLLHLHGRWTCQLLASATDSGIRRALIWIGRGGLATWRLALTAGLAVAEWAAALTHLLAMVPILLWAWPTVLVAGRQLTSWRRHQIQEWTGIRIDRPYLPEPVLPPPRPDGTYQIGRTLYRTPEMALRSLRYRQNARDLATWRDLLWLLLDPVVGVLLAAVPVLVTGYCFFGLIWSWAWASLLQLFVDFPTFESRPLLTRGVPVLGTYPIATAPLIGVIGTLTGSLLAIPLLRLHGLWSWLLLGPTKSALLGRRVDQLTETRMEARETLSSELRRIERDLHDGAQAQWVAMGMKLGAIEALIERDPAAAKMMVGTAREASANALIELRHLIRGINPPVLAERGLADAIRGLALDSPLSVGLRIDLPGRPERPVEAAAYFAVSELLTNVSKHADASRVLIDVRYMANQLRIALTDNGAGGADPAKGSGLRGVQRRLATFDGTLAVHSPLGGPTTVTLEIPCVLSS